MQKTKKQLLGLAGLAAVGIMTAVAYTMPTPNAAALTGPVEGISDEGYAHGYDCDNSQPGNECATASDGVELNITVREGKYNARIVRPRDNSVTTKHLVDVEIAYEQVDRIETSIEYKNDAGDTVTKVINTFSPTNDYGTHTFQIDTAAYSETDRDYKLTVRGYNPYGAMREDAVTFKYRAVAATINGAAENGDPKLEVDINEEVEKISILAYDKAGNALFVDENGKEVPIILGRDAIDPKTGKILVQLPFEKYGAEPGEYTIAVNAYNADDEIISMVTTIANYAPALPETPNTGSLLGNLNITRVDYILTGLIAFSLVAGFALYLVCRKNRR